MYVDGSDISNKLSDITGLWIDSVNGDIYTTTDKAFTLNGINIKTTDVFVCVPSSLGDNTSCGSTRLFWSGSAAGLTGKKGKIDALHVELD